MNNITFEEVKDILKRSIDKTASMNEAIERTLQHIYLKGWDEGWDYAKKQVRQTGWTPISEGLPKVSDCYAVTRKIGDDLITSACYFDKINAWWYNDNQINHESERNCLIDVIAWQPLPEPYEPESEET